MTSLPVGSLFFPASTGPDDSGMIEGSWDGKIVSVFVCDLEQRAEAIETRQPAATVRVIRGSRAQAARDPSG